MRFAPCVLPLLLAACSGSVTAIRVVIESDPAVALTDAVVSIGPRSTRAPRERRIGSSRHIVFIVPESWAGDIVDVAITGVRGELEAASGSTRVIPIRGGEVQAIVRLDAGGSSACGEMCDAGVDAPFDDSAMFDAAAIDVRLIDAGVIDDAAIVIDAGAPADAAVIDIPRSDATPAAPTRETLISGRNFRYPRIVVDEEGTPTVAFIDDSGPRVMRRVDGSWRLWRVATDDGGYCDAAASYASIALLDGRTPIVTYRGAKLCVSVATGDWRGATPFTVYESDFDTDSFMHLTRGPRGTAIMFSPVHGTAARDYGRYIASTLTAGSFSHPVALRGATDPSETLLASMSNAAGEPFLLLQEARGRLVFYDGRASWRRLYEFATAVASASATVDRAGNAYVVSASYLRGTARIAPGGTVTTSTIPTVMRSFRQVQVECCTAGGDPVVVTASAELGETALLAVGTYREPTWTVESFDEVPLDTANWGSVPALSQPWNRTWSFALGPGNRAHIITVELGGTALHYRTITAP